MSGAAPLQWIQLGSLAGYGTGASSALSQWKPGTNVPRSIAGLPARSIKPATTPKFGFNVRFGTSVYSAVSVVRVDAAPAAGVPVLKTGSDARRFVTRTVYGLIASLSTPVMML